MRIGDTEIGPGHPVYVIAEIGVNHDGEVGRALGLVDGAAEAGADAIKMQYFEADRLMSRAAKLAAYQKAAGEQDPVEMLRRLELTLDDMARVVDRAHELGIHAIVSIFSVEHVEPVARLPWDAFKSASSDLINRPLLDAMAATGRPLIVSTGASTMPEVLRAAEWLTPDHDRLAVLQCVSAYPTPPEHAALSGIGAIARELSATPIVIGYSDHTESIDTGAAGVRHGAAVLEKHFTYSRAASGPDHRASLEPPALAAYATQAREASGRGAPDSDPTSMKAVLEIERDVRLASRQSLVTTRALSPGQAVSRDDLTIKRPGTGIPPFRLNDVIGRRVARPVEADMPLTDADLA